MADQHTQLTTRFFNAMVTGSSAEEEMMALFAPDAEYLEPFSGTVRTHRGADAIRAVFREGWRRPLPDVRIAMDTVTLDGDTVVVDWTCYSSSLPGGSGRGTNRFTVRSGRIVRLETRLR